MTARHDWVQADVRCLLCGRVLGRLIGPLPAGRKHLGTAGQRVAFAAFCPSDRSQPAWRLDRAERLRCSTCGGGVLVDEVEVFSTYDEPVDEPEPRPRRGRPPKPWRRAPDWRLAGFGLAG
jgi:DNA-directed RNA polymerase subunit N (RpoN/RPB10)